MRIAVLAGGACAERDVSLLSGAMVARALRTRGHSVALVDSFLGTAAGTDIESLFTTKADAAMPVISENLPDINALWKQREGGSEIGPGVIDVCGSADITFNALHGGSGEDGRMQAFLDMMGIRYTGDDYLASALGMHKDLAKLLFAKAGVPVPIGTIAEKGSFSADENQPYPCIVKPCSAGSSVGVNRAESPDELEEAVADAFRYSDRVLIEEVLPGREFAVGVLGGKALPVIEMLPDEGSSYDYAHKYQAGRTMETCPAHISAELEDRLRTLAEKACSAIGIRILARGEFMLDADGIPRCLEMNTLPGMTPVSLLPQEAAAAGMSFEDLCERIVNLSMERYLEQNADR